MNNNGNVDARVLRMREGGIPFGLGLHGRAAQYIIDRTLRDAREDAQEVTSGMANHLLRLWNKIAPGGEGSCSHDSSIEDSALRVLDDCNITSPVVNVVRIAKEARLRVVGVQMVDGDSYRIGSYDRDKGIISVSMLEIPAMKQFAIAHELGHLLLGHQHPCTFDGSFSAQAFPSASQNDRNNGSHVDTSVEDEADATTFAYHLLMPHFMLKEYLTRYNFTASDYRPMSKIFGVPVVAMKRRLEGLL